jgi:glycosyltransferase involved in cell wall biosynthesis
MKKIIFAKFSGLYGGDIYENWLFNKISSNLPIIKIEKNRMGGIKTIFSLFFIQKESFSSEANCIVRPFGLPVYKKYTVVIFHHYDHQGSPWYSKIIEILDFSILYLLNKFGFVKFICVSDYWRKWLQDKGFNVDFLIYNEINLFINSKKTKLFLAEKYKIDINRKWVFLGGLQEKKGGIKLVENIVSRGLDINKYEFIFTGKNSPELFGLPIKLLWIDHSDYYHFLQNCHVVIANSKFSEGWCRVLHEALCLGVPAAGSGAGGMSELLSLSGLNSSYNEDQLIEFIFKPSPPNKESINSLNTFIADNNFSNFNKLSNFFIQITS